VELVEVSAVHAFPAYSGTSITARARHGMAVPPLVAARRRRLLEVL
jgi:phage head maturation protease